MHESVIKKAVELHDPEVAKDALCTIQDKLTLTHDPNEREYLLFSMASCYGILGAFDEARRQLSLALNVRQSNDAKLTFDFMQGLLLQQEGKYEQALESFNATILAYQDEWSDPKLHFAYEDIQERRAFLMVTLKRFAEAKKALTKVLTFDLEGPLRSDAYASLGLCHLELREYEAARNSFLKAMSIGLTKQWRAEGHFYLGISYYHTNMNAEARDEFQKSLELATQYPLPIADIYSWLAAISKRLGNVAEGDRYKKLSQRN